MAKLSDSEEWTDDEEVLYTVLMANLMPIVMKRAAVRMKNLKRAHIVMVMNEAWFISNTQEVLVHVTVLLWH